MSSSRNLISSYANLISTGVIKHNPAQEELLSNLQRQLGDFRFRPVRFRRLFPWWKTERAKGSYIFGDVGTGKTMLMDMVYDFGQRNMMMSGLRLHFNQFMLQTHERVHQLKKHGERGDNIVKRIAQDLSTKYQLLCLDEFQVVDIADAMLLRALLEVILSKNNIFLMITSNRAPDDLYLNGIQRASFVPCIELIKGTMNIYKLNSGKDYRILSKDCSPNIGFYFYPNDPEALKNMLEIYLAQIGTSIEQNKIIDVMGRSLNVRRAAGRTAWFHFDELFRSPLSALDYLALTRDFDTFFIEAVPSFNSMEMRMEARRFMTFLDVVYDGRKKLAIQAEVPIPNLFNMKPESLGRNILEQEILDELQHNLDTSILTGAEERFAAARTISRLYQMTSHKWWSDNGMNHPFSQ